MTDDDPLGCVKGVSWTCLLFGGGLALVVGLALLTAYLMDWLTG